MNWHDFLAEFLPQKTMRNLIRGLIRCWQSLIGETVRGELFGSRAAVGASIRFKQINCEVIGVLCEKGQGAFCRPGRRGHDAVH